MSYCAKKTKNSCRVATKEKGENPSSGFLGGERNLVRFPSRGPEGKGVSLRSCQVHLSSSREERKRREWGGRRGGESRGKERRGRGGRCVRLEVLFFFFFFFFFFFKVFGFLYWFVFALFCFFFFKSVLLFLFWFWCFFSVCFVLLS